MSYCGYAGALLGIVYRNDKRKDEKMKTVSIQTRNGTKQISKLDFVAMEVKKQFFHLANGCDNFSDIMSLKASLKEQAEVEFDAIYNYQS